MFIRNPSLCVFRVRSKPRQRSRSHSFIKVVASIRQVAKGRHCVSADWTMHVRRGLTKNRGAISAVNAPSVVKLIDKHSKRSFIFGILLQLIAGFA